MARKRIDIRDLVESAKKICRQLTQRGIAHVVVGGVAGHLHAGNRQQGDDIDFFIVGADEQRVMDVITGMGFEQSGKYYKCDNIKIQIKLKGYSSYPDPRKRGECVDIDGVRVPTLEKTIDTKAEACRDILNKVLLDGIGGPSRRNSLIKHSSDLIALVRAFGSRGK